MKVQLLHSRSNETLFICAFVRLRGRDARGASIIDERTSRRGANANNACHGNNVSFAHHNDASERRRGASPKTGGLLPASKTQSSIPSSRQEKIKHTPLRSLANNIWGLVRGKTALNTCLIIHTINKKVSHFLNNLDVS